MESGAGAPSCSSFLVPTLSKPTWAVLVVTTASSMPSMSPIQGAAGDGTPSVGPSGLSLRSSRLIVNRACGVGSFTGMELIAAPPRMRSRGSSGELTPFRVARPDRPRRDAAFGLLLWPEPPLEEVAATYAEHSFRSVHVDTLERETEGDDATRTEANVDRLQQAFAAD